MKNILSLTKVGNLKLGKVKNGSPIATDRILVTLPTKENTENFKIIPGFNEEGEESVEISLPFDKIDLNFEVFYVGFAKINDIEYIMKAKDFGENLYLYPLNIEDFDQKIIDMGELTKEIQEKYQLKRTGFLKAYLNGYSGFGEVFYFKTGSINSIKTIQDQLRIISALTNGQIAGIPLVMRPIKKDIEDKTITYISLTVKSPNENGGIFNLAQTDNMSYLSHWIDKRENSLVDFEAFQDLYEESREVADEDLIKFEDLKNPKIEIETNAEAEIAEIENKAGNKELTKEEVFVKDFFEENKIGIPALQGVAVLKHLNGNEEEFKKYFSESRTLADVLSFITK